MIELILFLVLIGVLLYLIGMIPMDATILAFIRVVVLIAVVIYLFHALGLMTGPMLRLR